MDFLHSPTLDLRVWRGNKADPVKADPRRWRVPQESPTRVPHKGGPRIRLSHESVAYKSVLQECHLQECETMFGLLVFDCMCGFGFVVWRLTHWPYSLIVCNLQLQSIPLCPLALGLAKQRRRCLQSLQEFGGCKRTPKSYHSLVTCAHFSVVVSWHPLQKQ